MKETRDLDCDVYVRESHRMIFVVVVQKTLWTYRIVSTLKSDPNAGDLLGTQLCIGGDLFKSAKHGKQYL